MPARCTTSDAASRPAAHAAWLDAYLAAYTAELPAGKSTFTLPSVG